MKLIYMDESGHTGRDINAQQPMHYLVALCVDEQKVLPVERAIRTLAFSHLGADASNTDFEFKGHGLRSGKGHYFEKLHVKQRQELTQALLTLLAQHDISVIWAGVDKARSMAKLHPQQLSFLLVVERVDQWLKNQDADASGSPPCLGLLIADEFDELEQRLIDDLERYKTQHVDFGYRMKPLERVIDSVHFVRSFNNPLIQLADVTAYFLNRGRATRAHLWGKYQQTDTPLDWLAWQASHARPAEKFDLQLLTIIQASVRHDKVFP